jgi:hypothetical protein
VIDGVPWGQRPNKCEGIEPLEGRPFETAVVEVEAVDVRANSHCDCDSPSMNEAALRRPLARQAKLPGVYCNGITACAYALQMERITERVSLDIPRSEPQRIGRAD